MVRAVKGLGGDISAFFGGPIAESPHDLMSAVNLGLSVISWHENLPAEEQPPRHIWWSEELLEQWFEGVRERRKERYGGTGSRSRSSYEQADDVPMADNELAAQYRPN